MRCVACRGRAVHVDFTVYHLYVYNVRAHLHHINLLNYAIAEPLVFLPVPHPEHLPGWRSLNRRPGCNSLARAAGLIV